MASMPPPTLDVELLPLQHALGRLGRRVASGSTTSEALAEMQKMLDRTLLPLGQQEQEKVAPRFLSLLPLLLRALPDQEPQEEKALLEWMMTLVSEPVALLALYAFLRACKLQTSSARAKSVAARLLLPLCSRESLAHILEHENTQTAFQHQLSQALISLPDTVANAFRSEKIPFALRSRPYFTSLSGALVPLLERCPEAPLLVATASRLLQCGQARTLLRELARDPDGHAQWLSQLRSGPLSAFIRALLHLCASLQPTKAVELTKALLPATTTTAGGERLSSILVEMLLHKVLSKTSLFSVISYLHGHGHERFMPALQQLLAFWGTKTFIQQSSEPHQMSMSQAIIFFLSLMDSDGFNGIDGTLLSTLLDGIQIRLHSPTRSIRWMGTRVAEQMSLLLSPNEPLCFEDDVPSLSANCETLGLDLRAFSQEDVRKRTIQREDAEILDVDEKPENQIPENVWDNDDDDDDHELEALPEGKPRKSSTSPMYLRECLSLLSQSKELEPALVALPNLIRTSAETKNVAVALCKRLLHTRPKGFIANIEELQKSALVALAVTETELAVPVLTSAFYAKNYTIQDRMMILAVLSRAATELSSFRSAPAPSAASQRGFFRSGPALRRRQSRIIAERIERNTRRWSKKPTLGPKKTAVNRFGEFVGLFVYPLLCRVDDNDLSFRLLDEDAMVLARLVQTLGVFVEAAVHSIRIEKICLDIMKLLWFTRQHEKASVRCATLWTLSQTMLALPSRIEPTADLVALLNWLPESAERDPDDDCRALSHLCFATLHEKLDTLRPFFNKLKTSSVPRRRDFGRAIMALDI